MSVWRLKSLTLLILGTRKWLELQYIYAIFWWNHKEINSLNGKRDLNWKIFVKSHWLRWIKNIGLFWNKDQWNRGEVTKSNF